MENGDGVTPRLWDPNEWQGRSREQVERNYQSLEYLVYLILVAIAAGAGYYVGDFIRGLFSK